MKRFTSFLSLIALCLAVTQNASAQSLLDRLGGLLPQGEEPADAAADPADDTPRPPDTPSPRGSSSRSADSRSVLRGGPGYLGLTGDDTDGAGVVVIDVEKDTAAARAGFQPGDLIVSIGGTEIKSMKDMARLLQRRKAGDRVDFVVVREDGEKKISGTLTAGRRADAATRDDLPAETERVPARGPVLGVTLAPISDELREQYGFSVEEGAVIASIEPGTPAHRQRLPIGGVIVDANGKAIKGPEDLQELVASSKDGDELELVYYIGKQRYRTKLRLAPAMNESRAEPARVTPPSDARGGGLERRLGDSGRRPLLGKIGRVLDDIDEFAGDEPPPNPDANVAPDRGPTRPAAAEEEELPSRVDDDQSQMLREEIELLRREISLLRKRVDELERKLKQ
jgi:hypothetical protein